jgi:hypothetical protein
MAALARRPDVRARRLRRFDLVRTVAVDADRRRRVAARERRLMDAAEGLAVIGEVAAAALLRRREAEVAHGLDLELGMRHLGLRGMALGALHTPAVDRRRMRRRIHEERQRLAARERHREIAIVVAVRAHRRRIVGLRRLGGRAAGRERESSEEADTEQQCGRERPGRTDLHALPESESRAAVLPLNA